MPLGVAAASGWRLSTWDHFFIPRPFARCHVHLGPPLHVPQQLTRDDIVRAIPLCINIIRIGTTLVFPNGQRFAREDMSANLPFHLVLALATLDEISGDS